MHHVHAACTTASRRGVEDGPIPLRKGIDVPVQASTTTRQDAESTAPLAAWWQRWLTRPLAQAAARTRARKQAKAPTQAPAVSPLPVDPGRLSADLTLIRAARIHTRPGPVRRRRVGLRPLP